jgi:hypothetical protein
MMNLVYKSRRRPKELLKGEKKDETKIEGKAETINDISNAKIKIGQ